MTSDALWTQSTSRRIAICSRGDPFSSRTWSGTPANLSRAFREAGVEVTGVDFYGRSPRPVEVGLKVLSKIYYLNSRFARLGRIEQPYRSWRASKLIRQQNPPRHLLHLHALDALSIRQSDAGDFCHSMMLDTTWHLWRTFCTDVHSVTPRLSRDAEHYERQIFARIAHFFPISEYAGRDLIEHYGISPEKITVVGTGMGGMQPYFGSKDYFNCSILFAAKERFVDKGGQRLLEGFEIARKKDPRLNLTIVGRPEYLAQFGRLPGVTALGHIPFEDLQMLFNRASLFALPGVFEPWGLVYLEALACQTPVMGMRHHALPEITQNGRFGFCLESGTPAEIAETLLFAFADPERLKDMGSTGQQFVLEHFTWAKTARRILRALEI